MVDFFETYKNQFLYALLVIGCVIVLRFITTLVHKWLMKVREKRFPNIRESSFNLLRRVLNTFWIVLGVVFVSFLSFDVSYDTFVNNFRLTLYVGFLSIITIVGASTLNIWFRNRADKKVAMHEDPTVLKFTRYVAVWAVYIVGIMFILLAFPSLKGVAQTALGGAGIIALIAGVASQEALANLVGGLFIISFKPFKIGDVIKISGDVSGTVIDITLRHTIIRNGENKMIVIPNAAINKEKIINFNMKDTKICQHIEIGISYESDIDLAKKIMQDECENHPLIYDNRSAVDVLNGKPLVRVALISLEDSSITLRAWAWTKNNSNASELKFDVLESIKKRFDKEGIDIPYPHRTIIHKNKIESSEIEEKNTRNDRLNKSYGHNS